MTTNTIQVFVATFNDEEQAGAALSDFRAAELEVEALFLRWAELEEIQSEASAE
jgi:hypothetical protein